MNVNFVMQFRKFFHYACNRLLSAYLVDHIDFDTLMLKMVRLCRGNQLLDPREHDDDDFLYENNIVYNLFGCFWLCYKLSDSDYIYSLIDRTKLLDRRWYHCVNHVLFDIDLDEFEKFILSN